RAGRYVTLPERPAQEAVRLNEYGLAVEVLRRLGQGGATAHEAAFLAMNARDARYGPAELHNRQPGLGPTNRAWEAATEFARLAGSLLGVDVADDEELIRGLILHLEPAIDRLELGVVAPNPLLDEIKAKYSGLYAVATQAAESLTMLPAGLAEEEIGYLAVHLGAALERRSDPSRNALRAVLVCEHGVGTAQLLASTLAARLPELKVCGFASSHGVEQTAAECRADVILTTRPLAAVALPVFLVHPLPDLIELTALRARLQSLLRRPRAGEPRDPRRFQATNGGASPLMLEDVLTHQTIALDVEASDWQEAIRKVGELMVSAGAVRPEYVDGMIRTVEAIGPYVVVGPGIAMPHARPEDGAVNVGMACVRLATPVVFAGKEDNPIDLLFAFAAIDNQSHVAVMGQLARLLSTPSLVERVRQARTVADVLEVVHAVSVA
ncbi:MAG: BglG family transcription antiterminator, partial [Bacillota bacterium]